MKNKEPGRTIPLGQHVRKKAQLSVYHILAVYGSLLPASSLDIPYIYMSVVGYFYLVASSRAGRIDCVSRGFIYPVAADG